MKQHCFGHSMIDCKNEATILCGLCDGHYCDSCICKHYDYDHKMVDNERIV